MFTSTSSTVSQRALAILHMTDGKKLPVSIKLSLSGKLSETLNNADQYIDVIASAGQQLFINKGSIERVEISDPPQAKLNQQRRAADKAVFDPHAVLGVASGASKDDVRNAWVHLVKAYHPDRFANMDVPQEMKDYAAAMQARINMAYQQLSG
jgi:DnaJ-domain-containing protein 1